ncbi:Cytochrome c oxidase assembly protein 1 -like protein [Toxocara canis]|uniref:Cytochrome c oxidase assembly protein 1-like protein n=1 Tax=Toxocara canis TaxID=6265 RepID=A0A0B2VS57_TOXCA|nr:Cytochrome c oxidase assembly protein 1 -like protein [Toxocara canis]
MSGVLGRVKTSTLLQIAGGTLIVGSTCIYLAHKSVQRRVRALPHYRKALQIVAEHEQARNALGPPVVVGNVDLADRRRNYISDFTSELRIPVAGDEDSGFMEVRATRVSSDCDFEMAQIELELEKRNCRVIIYDNGKWTSQKGH